MHKKRSFLWFLRQSWRVRRLWYPILLSGIGIGSLLFLLDKLLLLGTAWQLFHALSPRDPALSFTNLTQGLELMADGDAEVRQVLFNGITHHPSAYYLLFLIVAYYLAVVTAPLIIVPVELTYAGVLVHAARMSFPKTMRTMVRKMLAMLALFPWIFLRSFAWVPFALLICQVVFLPESVDVFLQNTAAEVFLNIGIFLITTMLWCRYAFAPALLIADPKTRIRKSARDSLRYVPHVPLFLILLIVIAAVVLALAVIAGLAFALLLRVLVFIPFFHPLHSPIPYGFWLAVTTWFWMVLLHVFAMMFFCAAAQPVFALISTRAQKTRRRSVQ